MTARYVVVLVLGPLLGGGGGTTPSEKKALEALQGDWILQWGELNGKKVEFPQQAVFTIRGEQVLPGRPRTLLSEDRPDLQSETVRPDLSGQGRPCQRPNGRGYLQDRGGYDGVVLVYRRRGEEEAPGVPGGT
jgi:hypothetical protein